MVVRVDLDTLAIHDLRQIRVVQYLNLVRRLVLGRCLPVIKDIHT
jgi:hypothetical protein